MAPQNDDATFRYTYQEWPQPQWLEADDEPPESLPTVIEHEYTGKVKESERSLRRIRNNISRAAKGTGTFPDFVVVGIQRYVAADALVRRRSNEEQRLDDVVEPEVVTIPGNRIHVPKPNQMAAVNYVRNDD